MLLYGAGGHANVIYDCLVSQGIKIIAVFDDDARKSFDGVKVINPYSPTVYSDEKLIISIGSSRGRFRLTKIIKHDFGIAIHKTSYISGRTKINQGSMILAKSIIQPGVVIGIHTIVNTGAIIEHDSIVGDFVHVGPGAVLCGDTKIGVGTIIGANATILPGVSIGEWAVVGAGAVVLKDVESEKIVAGNPAKIIKE